ncbi:hypothetical protein H310_01582 [Aphanomyces invadans]|uniref:Uncharacterized protein n=1 Tax=Aphanomyces invadans TaxID=157072 RepID=A0A024UT98_9STRA|nr:hypothetical protein H310_01582 [Aphanomyces invadans]ETW09147.1 hypothetical protein H310_01582 [Aphanomyces invadans]|eukprot:XP_008862952.1 hypothetical protein H310_01582 [Aphanomyces invadans]
MAAAPSIVPPLVENALRDAIASFPKDLQDSLTEKFTAYYANPETVHVEQVVQKRMTDAHAQRLLFAPTKDHAAFYVLLVQGPPKGAPETHPCFIVCQRYLAMWYLCHARHWSLSSEFVLHGGLHSLVDLFTHENLHFRGQALDVFTQITSNPDFDWFQPPTCPEAKSLHGKMLLLANSTDFIRALVSNKDIAAMSLYALQILAFYMSWVRKLYSKGELRLSSALLATISDWKTTAASDEERELATNVFDDFNRWPAVDAPATDKPLTNALPVFEGVEYPKETLYLKQARDALVASDYDQTVSFTTAFLRDTHDAASADRVQALGLRGRARLLRQLDRADMKKAVDDTSSALDMLNQVAISTTQGDRDTSVLSRVDLMLDKATILAQHLNLFRPALAALELDDDTCLSADDVAALDAKRIHVKSLWSDYEALHGMKHAKEQSIFDAILHRRGLHATELSPSLVPSPTMHRSKPSASDNQESHDDHRLKDNVDKSAPPTADDSSNQATNSDTNSGPLPCASTTRLRQVSSVASKNKATPSHAGGSKQSWMTPVARKLLKSKHDPHMMASLLESMSAQDIAAAVSTILNPDILRGLLQGAGLVDPKHAHEVLKALNTLPALPLVLELADPDVVAAMNSLTLHTP